MYHCDSVVIDGKVLIASISKYSSPPMNFKNINHLYSYMINDGNLRTKIEKVNSDIILGLNLKDGVSHLEVFVDENEEVIFCEIACRAGGSGIIPSVREAYGVNLFHACIQTQLNKPISFPTKLCVAAWIVIFKKSGFIKSISKEKDFDFDWVKFCHIGAEAGEDISDASSSTDSIAEFTLVGFDESDLKKKIKFILDQFEYDVI